MQDDSVYRYRLTRTLDDPRATIDATLTWVCLNPSVADEQLDDPTIRRVKDFTAAANYTKLVVVNLFAYRATKPRELARDGIDLVGPENDVVTRQAIRESARVVFAWGALSVPARVRRMAEGRVEYVRELARDLGHYPICLGVTASGQPRHPLFVPGDAWFHRWAGPGS